MTSLRIERLAYTYGGGASALADISCEVEAGRFLCLLGPSGCGKTTLLRLLGGYLQPTSGKIFLGDIEVTRTPPERRNIGMVFQNYALFPHLSARDNVAFSLVVRGVGRAECSRRVDAILERVHLSAAERARRPSELSGGQQQRVALARALVFEPRLLLLDEPFANLDRQLRERLRAELRDLQQQTGVTTVLVTHDQDEALSLADEIALMLGGRFLERAAPTALYRQPRTALAARLIGDANLLRIEAIEATQLRLSGGLCVPRADNGSAAVGGWVLVRPEGFRMLEGSSEACGGRVVSEQYFGVDRLLAIEIAAGTLVRARFRHEDVGSIRVGQRAALQIKPEHGWVIPETDPSFAHTSE